MSNERERDPSPADETDRSAGSDHTKGGDAKGPVRSAEWTTSTYRSSRKLTDAPGGKSKTPRRRSPSPDSDVRDDEHS